MFTGLVQTVGVVALIEQTDAGVAIFVDPPSPPNAPEWQRPFELGESIAINGCCLTLARMISRHAVSRHPHPASDDLLAFNAIPETLAKTTLGSLSPGSRVNLERAATPLSFLGGHIVQGHVDGVARVVSVTASADWRVRFQPTDPAMMQFIIPKGSICIDGVSLTIAALNPGPSDPWFDVALIPTTLDKTTLRDLQPGRLVNLEVDCMAKTIVHYLQHFTANRSNSAAGE